MDQNARLPLTSVFNVFLVRHDGSFNGPGSFLRND